MREILFFEILVDIQYFFFISSKDSAETDFSNNKFY
jgi:hypothetical protein